MIIAGCRDVPAREADELVERAMDHFERQHGRVDSIIVGDATGIDRAGLRWAEDRYIPRDVYTADWRTHGRAAGPIRNSQMAAAADALVAVWDGKSRGTADMIRQVNDRGLVVWVQLFIREERHD